MHAASSCSLHAGGGLELRRAPEASSPQSPTASLNFFTAWVWLVVYGDIRYGCMQYDYA